MSDHPGNDDALPEEDPGQGDGDQSPDQGEPAPPDEGPGIPSFPSDSAGPAPGSLSGGGAIEEIQHRQVAARVPESVARGVFSTGAIVITGQNEFVIDFVLRMARPHQVVARMVVPHPVLPLLIAALQDNLGKYEARFGAPPQPQIDPGPRPSVREIYDELKMGDDVMSGSYCNAVMIGHTPTEFSLDFITNFFPQAAVSRRVFLAAGQVPRFLESLKGTYEQFIRRQQDQG